MEQIAISPNGEWSIVDQGESKARPSHTKSSDEEYLIEIPDTTLERESAGYNPIAASFSSQTPIRTTREPSAASGPAQSSSGKRPHSAVIDLTLDSDEEDDEPIRGPKRLAKDPPSSTIQHSFDLNTAPFDTGSQDAILRLGMPRPDTSRPPVMNYDYSRRLESEFQR